MFLWHLSNLRRGKRKKKKSEAKICFKDKKDFFSSFQRWPPETQQPEIHIIREGQKQKTVHPLPITLRDTNTLNSQGYHKLNFVSPGIFLSCHAQNYHTPSPKQPFHLATTITSRILFLNFSHYVTGSFFLTSSINFTHDYYKTTIKPACANIILFLW